MNKEGILGLIIALIIIVALIVSFGMIEGGVDNPVPTPKSVAPSEEIKAPTPRIDIRCIDRNGDTLPASSCDKG